MTIRALHVASELYPLLKTGGLADVAGALPPALIERGADVRVLLPGFPAVVAGLTDLRPVAQLGRRSTRRVSRSNRARCRRTA
jgi:Glycogen synthase